MPSIYLITGVMAAGKSTVGELLAGRFPYGVHLRGDVFRGMIVSGREDMTPQASPQAAHQLNLRYELSALAAQKYLHAGFDVVYQDVIIGRMLSKVVSHICARPLCVVVLCPDPQIVALREAERSKTGYAAGFTPDNLHRTLVNETPRIGMWIDNGDLNPEQTMEQILRRASLGEGWIS